MGNVKYTIVLLLSILIWSCQSPKLSREEPLPVTDTDWNYRYGNLSFQPVSLVPPYTLSAEETIAGLSSTGLFSVQNHILTTTTNGFLYLINSKDITKSADTRIAESITAPPALDLPLLYITSEQSKYGLMVYHLYTGKVIWELPLYFSRSTPIVAEKRLFHAGLSGRVSCLNAATGQLIWQHLLNDKITCNMALAGNQLIVATEKGLLTAFDLSSGALIWQNDLKKALIAPPVIYRDQIILNMYDGQLVFLNLQNGQQTNTVQFATHFYISPLPDKEALYVISGNGILHALHWPDMKELWQIQLDGSVRIQPLATKEHLLVGTTQSYFYIIDKESGTVSQSLKLPGRLSSVPLIDNNKIILGYEYNKLAVFKSNKRSE